MKIFIIILLIASSLNVSAQKPDKVRIDTTVVKIHYVDTLPATASDLNKKVKPKRSPLWVFEKYDTIPITVKTYQKGKEGSKSIAALGVYTSEYLLVDSARKNKPDTTLIKHRATAYQIYLPKQTLTDSLVITAN